MLSSLFERPILTLFEGMGSDRVQACSSRLITAARLFTLVDFQLPWKQVFRTHLGGTWFISMSCWLKNLAAWDTGAWAQSRSREEETTAKIKQQISIKFEEVVGRFQHDSRLNECRWMLDNTKRTDYEPKMKVITISYPVGSFFNSSSTDQTNFKILNIQ